MDRDAIKELFRRNFGRDVWIVEELPGNLVFVYCEQPSDSVHTLTEKTNQWAQDVAPVGVSAIATSVQTLVWRSRYCGILHAENATLRKRQTARRVGLALAQAAASGLVVWLAVWLLGGR